MRKGSIKPTLSICTSPAAHSAHTHTHIQMRTIMTVTVCAVIERREGRVRVAAHFKRALLVGRHVQSITVLSTNRQWSHCASTSSPPFRLVSPHLTSPHLTSLCHCFQQTYWRENWCFTNWWLMGKECGRDEVWSTLVAYFQVTSFLYRMGRMKKHSLLHQNCLHLLTGSFLIPYLIFVMNYFHLNSITYSTDSSRSIRYFIQCFFK